MSVLKAPIVDWNEEPILLVCPICHKLMWIAEGRLYYCFECRTEWGGIIVNNPCGTFFILVKSWKKKGD